MCYIRWWNVGQLVTKKYLIYELESDNLFLCDKSVYNVLPKMFKDINFLFTVPDEKSC